jgi:hypothetical protein
MRSSTRSRQLRSCLIACATALALVPSGVGREQSTTAHPRLRPVSVKFVPAPRKPRQLEFLTGAWSQGLRRLIVAVAPVSPRGPLTIHLYTMRVNGRDLRPVPLTREADCPLTDETLPALLGEDRVVYWSVCLGTQSRPPEHMRSLMAYDFGRRTTTRYVERYFRFFEAGRISFSPITGAGVMTLGNALDDRLFWVDPAGLTPLPVPYTNVRDAAWSPNGARIAVSGHPESAPPDSPTAPSSPWSVGVLDERGRYLRTLVRGLKDEAASAWSPDSRWIAIVSAPKRGPRGVWVINVNAGRMYLVLRGSQYGKPIWLPDGRIVVPVGGLRALGYRGRYGFVVVTLKLPKSR